MGKGGYKAANKQNPIRSLKGLMQTERVIVGTCVGETERADRFHRSWSIDLCQQFGTIQIDDKCYCRKHAGMLALDMWIDGRLVEKEAT